MSDAILASRLRERITFEQPDRTEDEYGGGEVVWTEVVTVYASVQPIMGTAREITRAEQVAGLAGYRITVRRRDDVHAGMRIQWRARSLKIHSLHDGDITLEILAYEEMA